jgi:hypothetical protein
MNKILTADVGRVGCPAARPPGLARSVRVGPCVGPMWQPTADVDPQAVCGGVGVLRFCLGASLRTAGRPLQGDPADGCIRCHGPWRRFTVGDSSGNIALRVNQYLCPRDQGLMERAVRVYAVVSGLELDNAHRPLRRATVYLSCSCGSQSFKCPHSASAGGSALFFRSFSGRGNHRGDTVSAQCGFRCTAPKEI